MTSLAFFAGMIAGILLAGILHGLRNLERNERDIIDQEDDDR